MKKAKMMLTAIAIIAVVGGALAFKTQKFTGQTFYHFNGTDCVDPVHLQAIADPNGQLLEHFSTTTVAGDCETSTVFDQ